MKNMIITTMFALVIGVSTASYAQQTETQDPAQMQDQSQMSAQQVSGTASSVDQDAQSITVRDSASGTDRTFSVSQKDQLEDIKPGDQVNVTPDQNNASSAQSVEKRP
jgi:Cu/Ag efflux protein CusF